MKKNFVLLLCSLLTTSIFSQNSNIFSLAETVTQKKESGAVFGNKTIFTKNISTHTPSIREGNGNVTYLKLESAAISDIITQRPSTMELHIPFKDSEIAVELVEFNPLTDDFTVLDAKTNARNDYKPGVYYRGVVKNDDKSIVAFSFMSNQVMGVVSSPEYGNVNIGKLKDAGNIDNYVAYSSKDIDFSNQIKSCGVLEKDIQKQIAPTSPNSPTVSGCVRVVLETDYDAYVYNGSSVQNTVDFITGIFNVVIAVYQQESISMKLSQVYVWKVADPYPTNNGSNKLNIFSTNRVNFNGDLAQLVTFDPPTNSAAGGLAWINVLCGSEYYKHGWSDVFETYSPLPTGSYTVITIAHELGHNLGSLHTQSCTWPGGPIDNCVAVEEGPCSPGPAPGPNGGTVMSYCGTPALHQGFGPLPGAKVRTTVAAAACLSAACTNSGCASITNLALTGLPNGNSATFSWSAGSGNTSFNLMYRTVGAYSWTTIYGVTNPITLTVLTPSTNYEVIVYGYCSGTQSDFSNAILFTSAAGTCYPATALSQTVNNTSATLSWTENSGASTWQIVYGPTGFDKTVAGTTISVSTNPVTISGLTTNTSYDWYVGSTCASGPGGYAPYSVVSTFSTPSTTTYCTASYTVACNSADGGGAAGIIPVTIKTFKLTKTSDNSTIINNANNGCQGATSSFTSIVGSIIKGQSYDFSVSLGTSTSGYYFYAYIGVWIDYNNDGDFADANETVFLGTSNTAYSGSFTIPTSVTVGNKRLRVRRVGSFFGTDPSCTNFYDGEAEDYTLSVAAALPVNLLSFQANATKLGNHLDWQTATEINFSHYVVERSIDGISFEKLGEVKGRGNAQTYEFLDAIPHSGINYYRLKLIDIDGSSEYSKIVSVGQNVSGKVKIYPNPAHDVLNIDVSDYQKASVRVVDILGRDIIVKADFSDKTQIDLSSLANGIYFIEVNTNGQIMREKVVKN